MNFIDNIIYKFEGYEYKHWKSLGYFAVVLELLMLIHSVDMMFLRDIGRHALQYSGIVLLNVFSMIPLIFIYLSLVRGREKSKVTFFFRQLVFGDIVYLYLNSYTWIVDRQLSLRIVGYAISTIIFVDSIWMYFLFWKFMCSWLEKSDALIQKVDIYIKWISLVGVLLILGNIPGGYYYKLDSTGLYERTSGYWMNMIVPTLLVCAMVVVILRKKIQAWNKLFFLSYPILPFIGALISLNENGPSLLCVMTFIAIFLMYSNLFVAKQWENIEYKAEVAQQETKIANEKANVVISQIKPHFLYNSLVAIMEIEGNPPETKKALKNFAKYLRGNIRYIDSKNMIALEKEIEHVKLYTSLEMLRFPDINIVYDLKYSNFFVPPMSVQILVENAILHGVSIQEGGGTIWIESDMEENNYVIRIKDDGCGFDEHALDLNGVDEHGKSHVGINNVRMRLNMVGGELEFESGIGKGTVACIKLPRQ